VSQALKDTVRSVSNPLLALHELASLLKSFDEEVTGVVGVRAFLIACHRSRLLANMSENHILSLSDVLAADGAGKVEYTPFLVHLRALCSLALSGGSSAAGDAATTGNAQLVGTTIHGAPSIMHQLAVNGSDSRGTLYPLRRWLKTHIDPALNVLDVKDLNDLLREFAVMFRSDDLTALLMDIGTHVSPTITNSVSRGGYRQRDVMGLRDGEIGGANGTGVGMRDMSAGGRNVIDARTLLWHVMKVHNAVSTTE
jgi:hypothetical protein